MWQTIFFNDHTIFFPNTLYHYGWCTSFISTIHFVIFSICLGGWKLVLSLMQLDSTQGTLVLCFMIGDAKSRPFLITESQHQYLNLHWPCIILTAASRSIEALKPALQAGWL